jgi:ankyrin repeat protein
VLSIFKKLILDNIMNKKIIFLSILLASVFSLSSKVFCSNNIFEAIEQNNLSEVSRLVLDENVNVNISAVAPDGVTPLYLAISHNYIEIVKLLLKAGADIDKKSLDLVKSVGTAEMKKCILAEIFKRAAALEAARKHYLELHSTK